MRQKQRGRTKYRRSRFLKTVAMTLAAALILQNISPSAAMVWQLPQGGLGEINNTDVGNASDSNALKEKNDAASGGSGSNAGRATDSNAGKATGSDAEKATSSNAEKAASLNLIPNGDFEEIQSIDKTIEETGKTILKDFWTGSSIPVGWTELWNAKDGLGNVTANIEEGAGMDGSNAVHIRSGKKTARVDFSQKVKVDKALEKRYQVSFQVKADRVIADAAWKGLVVRIKTPNSSTNKEDEFKEVIKGTNDWKTVTFEVTPYQGSLWFSCEMFSESMQGDVWIDNIQMVPVYDLSLNADKQKMAPKDTFQLKLMYDKEEVTEGITWKSSNEMVAAVDEQGLVAAHQLGNTVITAEIDENNKVSCAIAVEDATVKAHYKKIRHEWRDRLTGRVLNDNTDPRYLKHVQKLTDQAQQYLDQMILSPGMGEDNRTTLWADIKLYDYPGYVTKDPKWTDVLDVTYSRVEGMAKAYAAEGGGLYRNEDLKAAIIDALEWLYMNKYNETYEFTKLYGNWWTWYIGLPKKLSEILILMYGELPDELFKKEIRTLEHFNEDPTRHYGVDGIESSLDSANLADTCLIAVLRASAAEDPLAMQMAAEAFVTIFPYVESENGFYEDGSCIQHKNLAYTGAYGSVLLNGAERVLALLRGTPWEPMDDTINNVFAWIMNGYFPLMADGGMMSMVSGRSVARPSNSEVNAAKGVLRPMAMLAELAPDEIKSQMQETIKFQLFEVMRYDKNYLDNLSLEGLRSVRELLEDESISGDKKELYHKNFGAMDKVTHHAEKFSLGISMYSNRISGYEIGNYENKKGWHQSDGVLYLYNGDQEQYSNDYWPTVDPHRLAGITTDHTEGSSVQWANYTSSKSWVGGTSILGRYGATGMDFEGENTSLTANKSWFTFDNEVVALGADISSDENKMTETIVENRKIRDDGSNTLIVDGMALAEKEAVMEMTWALLEGNGNKSQNIGYYFPDKAMVDVRRDERNGNWKDINGNIKEGSEDDRDIIKNYVSLAIPHGTMPAGASYSYVLLPGMSQGEVADYAANPAVEILSNSSMVQAVRHNGLNVTGYNFWKSCALDGITAKTPASVMALREDDQITFSISNPRQNERDTVIEVAGIYVMKEADEGVTVTQERNRTVITIEGVKDFGRTYTVVLQDETGPQLKSYQEQADALSIDSTDEEFELLIAKMKDTLSNENELTDVQKDALEQLIDICVQKKAGIQRVKEVLQKIAAISKVTLENADAAAAVLAEFDAMPDHEKSLLTAEQQSWINRIRDMFYVDEIIDKTTGVTITALPGCETLDLRTRAVIENQPELTAEYQERLTDGMLLNRVLDIRLMINDTPVEFADHPVRITIPVEETLKGRAVVVVYFAKTNFRLVDGDMIVSVIKDGRMSFAVESDMYFYGIAVEKTEDNRNGTSGNSGSESQVKSMQYGTWQKNARGWWYQRMNHTWPQNQWEMIHGLWYYFDADGYMTTGWQMINNQRYYLCDDGHMMTGWLFSEGKWYYLHDQGHMLANQWIQLKEDWYYMGVGGEMMVNAKTPDGYYVDANGVWR